jgi:hypothetical protein
MRTDASVASGDSKLTALMRQGVTVAHIVQLLQTAYPTVWERHLHYRLGATRPADLTIAQLAEFTDHVFWLVKQTGIRDPAAMLAFWAQLDAKKAAEKLGSPVEIADIVAQRKSAEREPVTLENSSSTTDDASPPRPVDLTMTTGNPFDGREHDGRVFRNRHERNFFIGRLSPRQKEEWLRDHPDRWQTREEFLRDLQARAGTDVEAKPTEPRSTLSATEVPTGADSDGRLMVPGPQPHKSATNTAPPTIANPEATAPATAAAGDEINIGGRRFLGERRVAEMLGCSLRTLQRWRMEGKGPPSTKIGRKVFYELNDLQEWIDRGKIR